MTAANVVSTGSLTIEGREGAAYHGLAIIAIYLISGVVVGGVVGALSPLMRHDIGAGIVGMVASLPMLAGILATRHGSFQWERTETISLTILVIVFGIPGGVIIGRFIRESAPDKRHRNRSQ